MKKLISSLLLVIVSQLLLAQGRIIVWLKPGVPAEQLALTYPVTLTDFSPGAPFALYTVIGGQDPHIIEADMRAGGLVNMAEDDHEMVAPENVGAGKGGTIGAVFDPGALFEENRQLLSQINYRFRHLSLFDRPVRIAILDTGVPALNLYIRSRVVAGVGIASDRTDYFDRPTGVDTNHDNEPDGALGHGSMVSGLVAQIAPFARFVIARVADSDGVSSAWNLIKGIAFAAQNNAEVINISFGAVEGIPALKDVIENWLDPQGVLVVAAIGNNGSDSANSPASYSQVVCVSGVDQNNLKAPFSNWDGKARQSAPATGVKSCWWDHTMGVWSGTSFASPLVAATIADSLRSRPRYTTNVQLDALRDLINATGTDIDGQNPAYRGKLGRLLNNHALQQAIIQQ